MIKWTPDQQKAIDGRNGTMLVSAAAGSGKTAVLVERVIQRICDKNNPCSIENLLIVTFTKAAAAQMKEKITEKLEEVVRDNPNDKFIRRQKLMIPYSKICTIDSFCINLVRENFQELEISPDFSILDTGKIKILENTAVNAIIDKYYAENSDTFKKLTSTVNNEKDDSKLISAILKLYTLSQAYPFPDKWLNGIADSYGEYKDVTATEYGRIIIEDAKSFVINSIEEIEYVIDKLDEEPVLKEKYLNTFLSDRQEFLSLYDALSGNNWDEICDKIHSLCFIKLASAPRGYDSPIKDLAKNIRDNNYKKGFSNISKHFAISDADNKKDMGTLLPVIKLMVKMVLDYSSELEKLKKEENGLDFSDTLHYAINLLIDKETGERTALAKELSENYAEILVDEYQDVNLAQDMVFRALSKNDTNRFMVGDVKQSIYRFRQAMPDIFLSLKENFRDYDGINYPAKVNLGMNFRSAKGITETVNFVFRQLMTKEAGKIEYGPDEHLVAGASYPEKDEPETEILLIEAKSETYPENQAIIIGNKINKMIAEKYQVATKVGTRNIEYKDFAILIRSAKDRTKVISDKLMEMGIPSITDTEESFLESPEISFIISLLKIIDNPTDDIAMATVLLSPVFGFSPDDLAKMRIDKKDGSIYACLVKSSLNGNKKAEDFLSKLKLYRELSVTLPSGEFIANIVNETGYRALCSAMKNPETRITNINLFIEEANKYDKSGIPGISGFIRFITKLINSGGTLSTKSNKTDAANTVTITTVHKSKGLEYPVCFLACCDKGNNNRSQYDDMLITDECGIGLKLIENRAKFQTLPLIGSQIAIRNAEHSEELRVLYVAMTRPKEKLFIVAENENWENKLKKISANVRPGKKFSPYTILTLNGFGDYLLSALMKHPDAHTLREAAGLPASLRLECETRLKAEIIKDVHIESYDEDKSDEISETDDDLYSEIKNNLEYVYPYEAINGVSAWRAASDMDSSGFNENYFASSKPSFLCKGKLSPAERGIATHKFMQHYDIEKAKGAKDKNEFIDNELERLEKSGILSSLEKDNVDRKVVYSFFTSSLSNRMLKSDKILREYSFTASLHVKEIYLEIPDEIAQGEIVVINGITDCAFIENGKLVIIDYKTDRVHSENELKSRYSSQLDIYRKCLSMALGLEVAETYIYSFSLGKVILM